VNGSSRTTSCASGYSGSGTAITCSNGSWSSATGCSSNGVYSDSAVVFQDANGYYPTCTNGVACVLSSTGSQTNSAWVLRKNSEGARTGSGSCSTSVFTDTTALVDGDVVIMEPGSVGDWCATIDCAHDSGCTYPNYIGSQQNHWGTPRKIHCEGCSAGATISQESWVWFEQMKGGWNVWDTTWQTLWSTSGAAGYRTGSGVHLLMKIRNLGCSGTPSQVGYVFAGGSSAVGATRTASCASSFSGTASVVTCGTNLAWSASSGCAGTRIYSDSAVVLQDANGYYQSCVNGAACVLSLTGSQTNSAWVLRKNNNGARQGSGGCSSSVYTDTTALVDGDVVVQEPGAVGDWCGVMDCAWESGCTYPNHIGTGSGHWGTPNKIHCEGCSAGAPITAESKVWFEQMKGGWDVWDTTWQMLWTTAGVAGSRTAAGAKILFTIRPLGCPPPTQTGYTFGTGSSAVGASRTAACASGFSGTATSITCGSNLVWSTSSGCAGTYPSSCLALKDSGVNVNGWYTIADSTGSMLVYCDLNLVSGGWTRVARLDFGCNYCNGPGTSQDLIANPALTCGKVADSRVLNILSGSRYNQIMYYLPTMSGRSQYMYVAMRDTYTSAANTVYNYCTW